MKEKIEHLIKIYTHIKRELEIKIDATSEQANLVEKGQLQIVNNIIADLVDLYNENEDEKEID